MKEIKNTTLKINVNGTEYEVFNGTYKFHGVWVTNHKTGVTICIKKDGAYANRAGIRNALIRGNFIEALDNDVVEIEPEVYVPDEDMSEDEMVTRAEYEAEIMAETMAWEHEAEVEMEMESASDLEEVLGECEDYPVVVDEKPAVKAEQPKQKYKKMYAEVFEDEKVVELVAYSTCKTIKGALYELGLYIEKHVDEISEQSAVLKVKNNKEANELLEKHADKLEVTIESSDVDEYTYRLTCKVMR